MPTSVESFNSYEYFQGDPSKNDPCKVMKSFSDFIRSLLQGEGLSEASLESMIFLLGSLKLHFRSLKSHEWALIVDCAKKGYFNKATDLISFCCPQNLESVPACEREVYDSTAIFHYVGLNLRLSREKRQELTTGLLNVSSCWILSDTAAATILKYEELELLYLLACYPHSVKGLNVLSGSIYEDQESKAHDLHALIVERIRGCLSPAAQQTLLSMTAGDSAANILLLAAQANRPMLPILYEWINALAETAGDEFKKNLFHRKSGPSVLCYIAGIMSGTKLPSLRLQSTQPVLDCLRFIKGLKPASISEILQSALPKFLEVLPINYPEFFLPVLSEIVSIIAPLQQGLDFSFFPLNLELDWTFIEKKVDKTTDFFALVRCSCFIAPSIIDAVARRIIAGLEPSLGKGTDPAEFRQWVLISLWRVSLDAASPITQLEEIVQTHVASYQHIDNLVHLLLDLYFEIKNKGNNLEDPRLAWLNNKLLELSQTQPEACMARAIIAANLNHESTLENCVNTIREMALASQDGAGNQEANRICAAFVSASASSDDIPKHILPFLTQYKEIISKIFREDLVRQIWKEIVLNKDLKSSGLPPDRVSYLKQQLFSLSFGELTYFFTKQSTQGCNPLIAAVYFPVKSAFFESLLSLVKTLPRDVQRAILEQRTSQENGNIVVAAAHTNHEALPFLYYWINQLVTADENLEQLSKGSFLVHNNTNWRVWTQLVSCRVGRSPFDSSEPIIGLFNFMADLDSTTLSVFAEDARGEFSKRLFKNYLQHAPSVLLGMIPLLEKHADKDVILHELFTELFNSFDKFLLLQPSSHELTNFLNLMTKLDKIPDGPYQNWLELAGRIEDVTAVMDFLRCCVKNSQALQAHIPEMLTTISKRLESSLLKRTDPQDFCEAVLVCLRVRRIKTGDINQLLTTEVIDGLVELLTDFQNSGQEIKNRSHFLFDLYFSSYNLNPDDPELEWLVNHLWALGKNEPEAWMVRAMIAEKLGDQKTLVDCTRKIRGRAQKHLLGIWVADPICAAFVFATPLGDAGELRQLSSFFAAHQAQIRRIFPVSSAPDEAPDLEAEVSFPQLDHSINLAPSDFKLI